MADIKEHVQSLINKPKGALCFQSDPDPPDKDIPDGDVGGIVSAVNFYADTHYITNTQG